MASFKTALQFTFLSFVLFAIPGCDSGVNVQISVLEGSWVLTGEDIDTFIDKTLQFNSDGHLTQVTTRVNNFGTEQRVVQPDVDRETAINGNNVRIEIPGDFVLGFTDDLVFEGTFNVDHTQAEGHLQSEANILGTIVITDQGPATIVKQ